METTFVLDVKHPTRPTPAQIDAMVETFEEVRDRAELAGELYEDAKRELIELVQEFGSVPAGAESSVRLQGALTNVTVTIASSMTVKDAEVGELKGAMDANDQEELFSRMFGVRSKYELLKGAENHLRIAQLPKRLTEKFTKLYARCFDIKKKSPSLKVERLAEAKKARAAKASKKGGR